MESKEMEGDGEKRHAAVILHKPHDATGHLESDRIAGLISHQGSAACRL